MSHKWYYSCRTCDETSEWLNRAEKHLLNTWGLLGTINTLLNADEDFEVHANWDYGNAIYFVLEHQDHDMYVVGEYSDDPSYQLLHEADTWYHTELEPDRMSDRVSTTPEPAE